MATLVAFRPAGSPASEPPLAPAVAAEPVLTVTELSHRYGRVVALDRVSLSLAAGETVALVGHSGSGKSTLLRLVAGLERPAGGTIMVEGREVAGSSSFVPPEARGIGMMFQDYALFPHLTVLRNVMFGLRRERRTAAETARRALARVGLAGRAGDYPHALSGGEQQRVALARALAPRPRILLMDEPFSNLDRRTRDSVRDETASVLGESGAAAILVTHDPDDALRMAHRIMLIEAGRIVESGTGEALSRRPASLAAARFFSDFNEIPGVVEASRVATALGDFPAGALAPGLAVTVCVRPGDIALTAGTGMRGTVAAGWLSGEARILTVAVPGLDRPIRVSLSPDDAPPPGPGAAVHLAVSPGAALIYPAS
jgi:iron(III) transport system ATP-binding protein